MNVNSVFLLNVGDKGNIIKENSPESRREASQKAFNENKEKMVRAIKVI